MIGVEILFVTQSNTLILYFFYRTEDALTILWKAIITKLKLALQIPIANLTIYSDSKLIIREHSGE